MFTGIVEALGTIKDLRRHEHNITFSVESGFLPELKIDQSISHNGVCLTVDGIFDDYYTVTAIKETLDRTNLGYLHAGDKINLERCMKLGDRLDGHLVQGHVDIVGTVLQVVDQQGSWEFYVEYDQKGLITVEKGSISVNGVSLTVVQSEKGKFSVAIIPYTYQHTNFNMLKPGSIVNLEFDILGKYILKAQQMGLYTAHNE